MTDTELISPTGEWEACGADKFFSKSRLYDMAWSGVTLSQLRVICAPFGGPIASTRDERQIVLITGGQMRPFVKVHSAAGHLLGVFAWERGPIVGMGWTGDEDLIIVEQSGEVSIYDMHGTKAQRHFSFGSDCQRDGILECCIYPEGVVVLTSCFALWSIASLADPRPQRLATPGITKAPNCMAVIEPRHTLSGSVEVLMACGESIMVVDADSAHTAATDKSDIQKLAVAPGGQFVAAFTQDGRLVVWVADFTKNLSEFSTESEEAPKQLAWCGTDSVVLAWEDVMLLVGPYGDWVKYDLEEQVILIQEVDGVRILNNLCLDFLRRVPDSLVDVFRIGSTAPGALLFDARTMFDQQNAKADEVLRSIVDVLPEAVATCAEGAATDFDTVRQSALLKAACYGRAFCPPSAFPRRRLLEICRLLRVLNELRQPQVGLPLSMAQLETLTPPALLQRLINGHRHLLALRVSTLLKLGPEKVLVHWACSKLSAASDTTDAALRDVLADKLKGQRGVSYTAIAEHAQALGRKGLAAMLLEFETNAAEQVPLLLRLGEEDRALQKAQESGDTDLVYLVLFSMYRNQELPAFVAAINARPATRSLFLAYCARTEPALLEQMCTTMGMYEGVAELRLREAFGKLHGSGSLRDGPGRRINSLVMNETVRLFERAADLYAQTKEHGFQSKAASEQAKLAKFQAHLEEETGNACFVGLTLVATAQQCIRLGNLRAAARVQSEFRIPDKRFWWLKVKTLAASKDWEGLSALASEKRSPVGVEPLIGISKEYGAPEAITARFIAKLPDSKKKAEEYAAIKMYQEAAEAAAQSRDFDMLSKIQGLVGATPLGSAVSQIKERLQASTR